jgi:hypothetical protein
MEIIIEDKILERCSNIARNLQQSVDFYTKFVAEKSILFKKIAEYFVLKDDE